MTDSYLGLQIMLKSGLVRISNKVTGNEFGNLGRSYVHIPKSDFKSGYYISALETTWKWELAK